MREKKNLIYFFNYVAAYRGELCMGEGGWGDFYRYNGNNSIKLNPLWNYKNIFLVLLMCFFFAHSASAIIKK